MSHNKFGDFKDGQWINGEFFARGGPRKGRKQSKNKAIYGIFAGDSDSDDDEYHRGNAVGRSNSDKPGISFIAAKTNVDDRKAKAQSSTTTPSSQPSFVPARAGLGNPRAGLGAGLGARADADTSRMGLGASRAGLGASRAGLGSDGAGLGSGRAELGSSRPGLGSGPEGLGSSRPGLGSGRPGLGSSAPELGGRAGLGLSNTSSTFVAAETGAQGGKDPSNDVVPGMSNKAFARLLERNEVDSVSESSQQRGSDESSSNLKPKPKPLPPRPRPPPVAHDPRRGAWEKHTKGIGMKLLMKMGGKNWSGRLGKHEDGVSKPVVTAVRPGQGAVGYYGKEMKHLNREFEGELRGDFSEADKKKKGPRVVVADVGSDDWKRRRGEASGKGASGGKRKRTKTTFKTAQQLLDEQNAANAEEAASATAAKAQIILDMRGPAVKRLDSMADINKAEAESDPAVEHEYSYGSDDIAKELRYNLSLLVSTAEGRILASSSKLKRDKDILEDQRAEVEHLSALKQRRTEHIEKLEQILQLLDRVVDKVEETCKAAAAGDASDEATKSVRVGALLQVFRTLRSKFADEYKAFKLEHILFATLPRLLKVQAMSWDPLAESSDSDDGKQDGFLDTLANMSHFLVADRQAEVDELRSSSGETAAERYAPTTMMAKIDRLKMGKEIFDYAVAYAIVPKLRRAILSKSWSARTSVSFANTLRRMWPLLTPELQTSIASANLFPAIRLAVQQWQPPTEEQQDTAPLLHQWLPLWLPFIGELASELWRGICHRIQKSFAQKSWTIVGGTALSIVEPLELVLPRGDFAKLLQRAALPLLVRDLRATEIDPANQSLEVANAVWKWARLLNVAELDSTRSSMHFRALWLGEFFPRLRITLHAWLHQANSPETFAEIEIWYKGWKSYFTDNVAAMHKEDKSSSKTRSNSVAERTKRIMMQLVDEEFTQWLQMIAAKMTGTDALKKLTPPDPDSCSYDRSLRQLQHLARIAQDSLHQAGHSGHRHQQEGWRPRSEMRHTMGGTVASDGSENVTFREVLEQLASREGVDFVPNFKRGRARSSGKQVYDFGGLSLYIDRDVAFVLSPNSGKFAAQGVAEQCIVENCNTSRCVDCVCQGNGKGETWEPVGIDELVQLVHERPTKPTQQARSTPRSAPDPAPTPQQKSQPTSAAEVSAPESNGDDVEDID